MLLVPCIRPTPGFSFCHSCNISKKQWQFHYPPKKVTSPPDALEEPRRNTNTHIHLSIFLLFVSSVLFINYFLVYFSFHCQNLLKILCCTHVSTYINKKKCVRYWTNMDKLLKQNISNKLRCRYNIYGCIFVGMKNTLFRGLTNPKSDISHIVYSAFINMYFEYYRYLIMTSAYQVVK